MADYCYNSKDILFKNPFGALPTGAVCTLQIRLPKRLRQAQVTLCLFADGETSPAARFALSFTELQGNCAYFSGDFHVPFAGLYFYSFTVEVGEDILHISRGRNSLGYLGAELGDLWQLTVYEARFTTPNFLKGGLMYQIFPDRFYKSQSPKTGVPSDRILREDWGNIPKYLPDADGIYRLDDYFGGDLQGIIEKLGYLKNLGVTVLYLNPIFEAHSNHRYNTADYKQIDPLLGTTEDFARLCQAAKAQGMAVLLDGVFSHTGSDSVYFNKEGRYNSLGAYQSLESPYASWYRFIEFPDKYEAWWGFETLPNLQECDDAYLRFICGNNGVLHHWLKLGAAGWRLDVADELPDAFIDALNYSVKRYSPETALIGEVWEDASNKSSYGERRRYFGGTQLDSVMNYPFREAILNFIRYGDGAQLENTVMTILENYPKPVIDCLMNSLSTHDVERAITYLVALPLGSHDRPWQIENHYLSPQDYARGKRLLKLASALQYTMPGTPCLYYGDEAGLSGYRDPFNRICYPWQYQDQELLGFFTTLGAMRTDCDFLATADFVPLTFDDDFCAYLRVQGQDALFVAVNTALFTKEIAMPPGFVTVGDGLGIEGGTATVLSPLSAFVQRLRLG